MCIRIYHFLILVLSICTLKVKPNTLAYNAAMNACSNAAQWQQCIGLLEDPEVEADISSFNIAMSACGNAAMGPEAIQLLCELERQKLEATTITYNTAIQACGNLSMSLLVFHPVVALLSKLSWQLDFRGKSIAILCYSQMFQTLLDWYQKGQSYLSSRYP